MGFICDVRIPPVLNPLIALEANLAPDINARVNTASIAITERGKVLPYIT
jgi:hypothetical protein